jgi:penicillin-binding protein 1A
MFCTPSKMLNRHLSEMRTAIQVERHYSRRQLFTFYANRVPVGASLTGVHDGSQFYFHKNPAELNVAEAALLVGLIRMPSFFSPAKHPDRALHRRDDVIDVMLENGSITTADAQAAKSTPLGVVPSLSTAAH